MAPKQPQAKKHVPKRMCIACRQGAGKRELVRVVRLGSEVKVDLTGKLAGRGAYLHPVRSCWHQALSNRLLQRSLRTGISTEDIDALQEYAETLPDVDPLEEDANSR
jgi:uncharacterized protein